MVQPAFMPCLASRLSCIGILTLLACRPRVAAEPVSPTGSQGAIAQAFYWRAKPGMLDAYNRYIRDVAEPIDAEARRAGAFISVTTFQSGDTLSPWTHMRLFILRDSAQLAGLGAALDAAGARLEPDSVKRRMRGEYSATLRDRVGSAVLTIVR